MKDFSFYEQSSLLYWWSKVKNAKVPKPKTVIISINRYNVFSWLTHGLPEKIIARIEKIGGEIGYPLFIRTDHFSNKWEFKNSCYVGKPDDIEPHILNLVDMSLSIDLPVNAIIVREYIEPDWKFKAFSGELPIAPERRYIVRDGKVVAHFPYWFPDAIRSPSRKDWLEVLQRMNEETQEEISLLTMYAEEIGQKIEGNWSIDFMKGKDGKWYFIDMAREEVSWKPNNIE